MGMVNEKTGISKTGTIPKRYEEGLFPDKVFTSEWTLHTEILSNFTRKHPGGLHPQGHAFEKVLFCRGLGS